jgi:AraC-like DNA-binding protein
LKIGTKEKGIVYKNARRLSQFHTLADSTFRFDRQPNFCSPRASQLSARYAPSATNCTLERKAGYAYLGTRSGLMIIDDEDRLITTLDERDGLSTSNIYALMADGRDDVWAVTANGISRVRATGRDSFLITNYGRFDGIDVEGREFRTCQIHRDTMGTITVGFVGGIVRFHPDSVTAPRYTFRYPRPFTADTLAESSSSKLWLWLILLVALLASCGLLVYRRSRHTLSPVMSTVVTDDVVNRLKTSPSQQTTADEQFLARLQTIVEANIGDEDFSVQTLSEQMAMDRTGLYRRMQALTGQSPSSYIKHIRLDVAARLLRETTLPIADIAMKTGFSTTKYFNRVFKDEFGQSPADFRSPA